MGTLHIASKLTRKSAWGSHPISSVGRQRPNSEPKNKSGFLLEGIVKETHKQTGNIFRYINLAMLRLYNFAWAKAEVFKLQSNYLPFGIASHVEEHLSGKPGPPKEVLWDITPRTESVCAKTPTKSSTRCGAARRSPKKHAGSNASGVDGLQGKHGGHHVLGSVLRKHALPLLAEVRMSMGKLCPCGQDPSKKLSKLIPRTYFRSTGLAKASPSCVPAGTQGVRTSEDT